MDIYNTNPVFDNLEETLLDDIKKNQSIMILARKCSGKSTWTNKLIKYSTDNNLFQEIWLVAPSINIDRGGTYDWLKDNKNLGQTKIMAFEKYRDKIITILSDAIDKEEKQGKEYLTPRLLVLDDFTTYSEIGNNPDFIDLLFESRHKRITIVAIAHALKLRNTKVRLGFENYILGRIGNINVLIGIWEELLSTWITKDEFFDMYKQTMNSRDYPLIMINSSLGKVDLNADDFFQAQHQFILDSLNKPATTKKIKCVTTTKEKQVNTGSNNTKKNNPSVLSKYEEFKKLTSQSKL